MITKEILKQIAPHANDVIITNLEKYINDAFNKYQINTYLRQCHFLAQAALETDGFKTFEEYASGQAYEGRKDLGNVKPGDGKRYKGRGMFQLTGRANYRAIGTKLGYDLENHPELAMGADVAILTACEYWNSHNLSPLADKDDIETITKRINGGLNGFADRKLYLTAAKKYVSQNTTQTINNASFNVIMARQGDKSSYISDLQNMLIKKGAKIVADGSFGPTTTSAVKDFQTKNNLEVTGNIDTNTLNKLMEN